PARPHRPSDLAGRALAGLHLLAHRPAPWARHRQRPQPNVDAPPRRRGGGDRRRRRVVAVDRCDLDRSDGRSMTATAPAPVTDDLVDVEAGVPAVLPRLLAGLDAGGGPVSLPRHREAYPAPPRPGRSRPKLISAVEQSGLRGRGGAGFPTARKLRTVAAGRHRPTVVVNGAEGEPASGKDKLLLRRAPHL